MNQGLRRLAESPLLSGDSSLKPKIGLNTHASPGRPSKPASSSWKFSTNANTRRIRLCKGIISRITLQKHHRLYIYIYIYIHTHTHVKEIS